MEIFGLVNGLVATVMSLVNGIWNSGLSLGTGLDINNIGSLGSLGSLSSLLSGGLGSGLGLGL